MRRRRRCLPHIAGVVHGLGLCGGTVRSGKSIHVQLRSGPDLRSAGQGKWVLSEVGLQASTSERGALKISLNRTDGVRQGSTGGPPQLAASSFGFLISDAGRKSNLSALMLRISSSAEAASVIRALTSIPPVKMTSAWALHHSRLPNRRCCCRRRIAHPYHHWPVLDLRVADSGRYPGWGTGPFPT